MRRVALAGMKAVAAGLALRFSQLWALEYFKFGPLEYVNSVNFVNFWTKSSSTFAPYQCMVISRMTQFKMNTYSK